MAEAWGTTKKVFLSVGHAAGDSKEFLQPEMARLCQAHGLSMSSLTAADGLAFIQAVASGCQLIMFTKITPRCPVAASFAATAALSGYSITLVAGNRMEYGEGVRMLSQQGSEASPCKLLSMQPGQETILAIAILAQILFKETMIGPESKTDAGGAQVAPAHNQQADAGSPAPLMLPGPPQETADASSGQTQQHFRSMPQQGNGPEQNHVANEQAGMPSSAEEHAEPNDTAYGGVKHAQLDDHTTQAEGGAAKEDQEQPESRVRGADTGKDGAAAAPAAGGTLAEHQHPPAAASPQPDVRQPPHEQTDIVDLISDSDDERAAAPGCQHWQQNDQSGPVKGVMRKAEKGRAAAVRRSARISSQCNSDASEGEGDHEQALHAHRARSTKAQSDQAKRGNKRKVSAEQKIPKSKRSRLNRSQLAIPDAAPAAAAQPGLISREALTAGKRKVAMKASPTVGTEPPTVTAATKAARGGKRNATRARKPPIETQQQQQQQHKQTGMREPPKDAKECAEPGGGPPQKDDSDWSSEDEEADHQLEQDDAVAQSCEAPMQTALASTAKAKRPRMDAALCRARSAGKSLNPAAHTAQGSEDVEAATPPRAAPNSQDLPSMKPESTPGKAILGRFSQEDVGALVEAFKQNREAASQSPGKKYKWKDKGKEKVSGMDEPRDPEQPGPSNAVYRPVAEQIDDSDDDDSIDLSTPLI